MVGILVALVVVWIVLAIIGFAVKALIWLAYVAIVLFVVTVIVGALLRFVGRRT